MKKKEDAVTVTRDDIARRVAFRNGSLSEAKRFTDAFFDELSEAIATEDEVRLYNFGVFRCIDKKPRPGRNPHTGEDAQISARKVATFVAGGAFKKRTTSHGQR